MKNLLILTIAFFLLMGCSVTNDQPFCIAWVSDTQYYAKWFPDNWKSMLQNINNTGYDYMIHSGDWVDEYNNIEQWENISKPLKTFNVPYGGCAGNHDNKNGTKEANFKKYIKTDPYVMLGSVLIIYINYGITEKELIKYDKIIKNYSNYKVVIVAHAYINSELTLHKQGVLILENLIVPNKNVCAILCGHHFTPSGSAMNVRTIKNRKVYEILRDYQGINKYTTGGDGYFVRLIVTSDKVIGETYSPILDEYKNEDYFEIIL